MNPLIRFKQTTLSLLVVYCACLLGASPIAQAVVPPPDGGYANFTTAEGTNALLNLTSGAANTAVGWFSLSSAGDASFNTATGAGALLLNTADENTAFGAAALLFDTTGENNTAVGSAALLNNTEGNFNTATGFHALMSNSDGFGNTAVGAAALVNNTLGINNTAVGVRALFSNAVTSGDTTTGGPSSGNTAVGSEALFSNISGSFNTANGEGALFNNTSSFNTGIGIGALSNNTTGNNNIALGSSAGSAVNTADNVIAIGTSGQDVSNSCFIGQIYTNIQPQVGMDPDLVTINSSGRLGRANVSSRRYKHEIKPMHEASEAIYALKPVSFRYHKEYDATQTIAFGIIAEEVAEVNRDLVGRNDKGQPESVRYEQINAMLLNEFLKEHRTVQELKATVAKQEATIAQQQKDFQATAARQQKQIETLTAGLQKVSVQLAAASPSRGRLELNKSASRTVMNNP